MNLNQRIVAAKKLGRDGFNRCVGHHLGIHGNPAGYPQELVDAYNEGYNAAQRERKAVTDTLRRTL